MLASPLSRGLLEVAICETRDWHEGQVAARKRWRAGQWWQFVQLDVASGGRSTFRWARKPALQAPPQLVPGDHGLEGGPAAVLWQAAAAWHPLWAKADRPRQDESGSCVAFAIYPRSPRCHRFWMRRLRRPSVHSRYGEPLAPNDWTGEKLRLWPGHLVSALAAFLRKVEELGEWPDGLWAAEVVLLPELGGGPGPAFAEKADHPASGDIPTLGQAPVAPG